MTKFKKIGEIRGYENYDIKNLIEILEHQGFTVVDDDRNDMGWKYYHILKEA